MFKSVAFAFPSDANTPVDDFAPFQAFERAVLNAYEAEFYEGDWLLNLPCGRTLEFDTREDAEREAARLQRIAA